jgi:hypothetical protein
MSVATEANTSLKALVQLTTKIESYLNPTNSKKGGAEGKTTKSKEGPTKGPAIDSAKEAMAIGGMATSIAKLIVATNVLSSKAGVKVKDFLVNFSEGLRDAANNIKDVNGIELIDAMTKMSKSIFSFALGMTAVALLAPAVALGTIVFILAIKGILNALKTANAAAGRGATALATLMGIGRGIALFALTMVGIALVAPLFAFGTLVFILAIKGILSALNTANRFAGRGATALSTLMKLGRYIAIFALTMVGIALVAPLFALGTLVFILAIKAITWAISDMGKKSVMINRGAKALTNIVKPMLFFGIVMVAAGFAAQYIAMGALVLGLAIGFVSIVMNEVGKKSIQINKGVKTLGSMAKPLAFFGVVMAIAGLVWQQILKGSVSLAAAMTVIGLAAYGLGKFDKDIKKGSVVLDLLIPPMIGFAVGVAIVGSLVKDDPVTLGLKLALMGAAIVGLGLAAAALGIPVVAAFVELGAGVLISLAASLVVFAGALWLLSKADFTKEKTENLGYAIAEIGFALAKFGLVAVPAAIGAAVLIPASLALLPLTYALSKFKTIDWQESDGEALKNALSSTVQGFAHALDGLGIKGILKAMAAIPMISSMGNALVSLAAGVKAMATLSFTEMEYDKDAKKLVPKRVVKLTDAEIQAVGPNTAMILNALAMPLTNFGMWSTMGETGFGPFTIGAGYMAKGIKAAAGIGNVISSIAKGVADMAQLNVVDYEVREGKLVPKAVRKLTPGDFILAALNTALILDTLVTPLSTFGKEAANGEGRLWGDGYVTKGIEAAGKVGNAIASIAKGVFDMASLDIVENEVVDGKLVPKAVRKLNVGDFVLAAVNVGLILETLTKPLTDFGRAYKDGSSWFTDSALEAGITATGKIVDPIAKMADMIIKLAGGQATINEVINPGTKDAKIVPKGVITFADAVPMAIKNVKKLLWAFPELFANLGIYIDKWEDEIDTAIEFMPKMSSASKDILDVSKSYLEITKNIEESSKSGTNIYGVISGFATSLTLIGISFNKMDNNKLTLYKKFASITEGMTKITTPFEKFTKTFGQFTKDMGAFVKVWDAFGKDDATNLKTYADSLKTIASVDAGKLSSVTKALKEQAQAQADLNNSQKTTPSGGATTADGKGAAAKPAEKAKQSTFGAAQAAAAAAPPPASQSNNLGGGVIARLEVTNLYINGKKW